MNAITLNEEEMYKLIGKEHNPPAISNQREENLFQAERRAVYSNLVNLLSSFGEEGDFYGISDFSVRPDLRNRPTVTAPPASHVREFSIMILTEKFFRSDYLQALYRFLCVEAPEYRIIIDHDFNQSWIQRIFLTPKTAWIYSSSDQESSHIHSAVLDL